MATRYNYPIDLHEEREGGYSVTFPDFDEALAEASDCLEDVLAGRIARREGIPAPSPANGRPVVTPGRFSPPRRHSTRHCAKSGCPTVPSRWPWAFRKARFDACSTPATLRRSACWRTCWRGSESASSSPWKRPPDRRSAPAIVSILP